MKDKILDFLYDKIVHPFYKYKEMISRMIFWGWNMRWNYDFDGFTLYEIYYMKLDRMYKCMSNYGNCVWNSCPEDPEYKLMKKLKLARTLAHRLAYRDESMYCIALCEKHDKK